jgi:hypothetical protein
MTEKFTVCVTPEIAKILRDREAETMVPTSRLIRKMIEQALAKAEQSKAK